ncbi:MAG TPA: TetR/AcrR family transcriptional regulator, partial [Patescibacteria group bacterium]|nr:TetR/AcrR family transcriptional regulator [Patescibacteria group bacterium]
MEKTLTRREREKIARKTEMVEVAERLFVKHGYEGTSMDDIAKEAEFTKRTLYQYFINKEDLFYAVVLKFSKHLNALYENSFKGKKTALEKFEGSVMQYYQFSKENPEIFRLMNYIPPTKPDSEITPNHKELMKFHDESFKMFTEIIEEGKKDGSVSPNLDAKKAAHFAVVTTISYMNTMSRTSDSY